MQHNNGSLADSGLGQGEWRGEGDLMVIEDPEMTRLGEKNGCGRRQK